MQKGISLKGGKEKRQAPSSFRSGWTLSSLFLTILLFSSLFSPLVTGSLPVSDQVFYDDHPGPDPGPVIPDPGNWSDRIGGFDEAGVGSFVSFGMMEDGIQDYTHYRYAEEPITLFESVVVEDLTVYEETPKDYTYEIKGDRADFRFYDEPSALMRVDVKPQETEQHVSFHIDEEQAEIKPGGPRVAKVDYGEFTGTLIPYGVLEGRREDMEDPSHVNFTIEERTSFFFRIEEKRVYDGVDLSEIITQSLEEGRLGAEARIEKVEDEHRQMSMIYGDFILQSQMLDSEAFKIMVSSDSLGEEGKVVVADISSTVMNISAAKDLNVTFDGEIIPEVGSYSELTARSDEACYWMVMGEEGVKVFVNVPNFSTHTIMIEDVADTPDLDEETYIGDYLYYIPGVLLSVAGVTFGAIYRKYRKKIQKEAENKSDTDEKEDSSAEEKEKNDREERKKEKAG